MQKIKNVTQTVPYYLMPQDRPLTGSSLETIREPCPSSTALNVSKKKRNAYCSTGPIKRTEQPTWRFFSHIPVSKLHSVLLPKRRRSVPMVQT